MTDTAAGTPRPLPDWFKTEAALEFLGFRSKYLGAGRPVFYAKVLRGLTVKPETSIRARPMYLYKRAELERVLAIVREAQISVGAAVRVVVAQNEGRL